MVNLVPVPSSNEQLYREYFGCWRSDGVRQQLKMSEKEVAYHLLEHAALWIREQTGKASQVPSEEHLSVELRQMSTEERIRIVMAACAFAEDFTLPIHLSRILQTEALEPEEIEEVEGVFIQVDGLDATVDLAVRLVSSELERNSNLPSVLTRARCKVATIVKQLSNRMDIAAVASQILLTQRQPTYLLDGRPADWFTNLCDQYKE